MRNSVRIFAVAAFVFAALAIPSEATAQWGIFGGSGTYNDNNSGYNRNSRAIVVNLKNHSREFARRLDRELDRSRYNGSWGEDRLNAMARELYQAADDLEDNWSNGRNSYRTDGDVRRVLMLGNNLDRELSRARLSWGLERDWSRVREDLSLLGNTATIYDRGRDRNYRDDDWDRGKRNNRGNSNGRNSNSNRKKGYPFPF